MPFKDWITSPFKKKSKKLPPPDLTKGNAGNALSSWAEKYNAARRQEIYGSSPKINVNSRGLNMCSINGQNKNVAFNSCKFDNTNWESNGYSNVQFINCLFDSIDLNSSFEHCNFSGSTFINCEFTGVCKYCDFTNAKLPKAYCEKYAVFTECNFSNADLSDVHFPFARMVGCNFTGANLTNAQLFYSDFGGSNFKNANLTNTVLEKTEMRYTNINEAQFNHTYIYGMKYDKDEITLPSIGIVPDQHFEAGYVDTSTELVITAPNELNSLYGGGKKHSRKLSKKTSRKKLNRKQTKTKKRK